MTKWFYASSFGYDVLLYTHTDSLPDGVTQHFVKILGAKQAIFTLGYETLFAHDWDSYIPRLSAVPLSLFLDEWPLSSVIMQGDANLCSCALLYRKTPALHGIFQDWWNLALTGHFGDHKSLHDQPALTHIVFQYLSTLLGEPELYPDSERELLEEGEPMENMNVSSLFDFRDKLLSAHSKFGFVGLDFWSDSYDPTHVFLHSCKGLWWGCVPQYAPALLKHHGHDWGITHDEVANELFETMIAWTHPRGQLYVFPP